MRKIIQYLIGLFAYLETGINLFYGGCWFAVSMDVENKREGAISSISSVLAGNSCSNAGAKQESVFQPKGITPLEMDDAPKVRKHYTITKQREKWTDEEHNKFLEALKLYGRGWRQIEEHVGTKTAVQIRSHAQKFFSKVSREGSGSTEVSIKPIEIPPPRPKRKPIHPYPRKFVRTPSKGVSVAFQPERSPSPNLNTTEKENGSPTSVLSDVGSDALESPGGSEQRSFRLSPTSCTTDVHSNNSLPLGERIEYMTTDSSAEEEKGSLSLVKVATGLTAENTSPMIFDLESKTDTLYTKGDATSGAPSITIKLFGQTVLVADSLKQSALCAGNFNALPTMASEQNYGIDKSDQLDTKFSLGAIYANWKPGDGDHKDGSKSTVATSDACLPRWAQYHGLPFSYYPLYNQTSLDYCREEGMTEKESHKEISCTDSNTGSVGEVESEEKNIGVADSIRQQPLLTERANPRKHNTKGFVPYKRCLAVQTDKSSSVAMDEREGQRIRVCL